MKFYFDNNLPIRLARMLNHFDAGHTVSHITEDRRFQHNTPDVDIIASLAAESPRPVFLTADMSMYRKVPVERLALADSGLTIVFFRRNFDNLDFPTRAWKLVKLWPQIIAETTRCRVPTMFEITAKAEKVQSLGPTAGCG
ncbi:MAG: hypothetical protein GX591_09400 [Planctomycetes bacterium]|nr:hypothetical protein [Planctomycetota bacterium]